MFERGKMSDGLPALQCGSGAFDSMSGLAIDAKPGFFSNGTRMQCKVCGNNGSAQNSEGVCTECQKKAKDELGSGMMADAALTVEQLQAKWVALVEKQYRTNTKDLDLDNQVREAYFAYTAAAGMPVR